MAFIREVIIGSILIAIGIALTLYAIIPVNMHLSICPPPCGSGVSAIVYPNLHYLYVSIPLLATGIWFLIAGLKSLTFIQFRKSIWKR